MSRFDSFDKQRTLASGRQREISGQVRAKDKSSKKITVAISTSPSHREKCSSQVTLVTFGKVDFAEKSHLLRNFVCSDASLARWRYQPDAQASAARIFGVLASRTRVRRGFGCNRLVLRGVPHSLGTASSPRCSRAIFSIDPGLHSHFLDLATRPQRRQMNRLWATSAARTGKTAASCAFFSLHNGFSMLFTTTFLRATGSWIGITRKSAKITRS